MFISRMSKLKLSFYILLGILVLAIAPSCNSTSESEPIVPSSNVAVTAFSINANDKLLNNIDSVHFTIDLNARRIYNADSLPKGTDVSKLVLNISFPTVSSAKLHVFGGKIMTDTIIDYATSPTDSIDCTGNVVLTVVSEDALYSADYNVKVNVHNLESDSLYWNRTYRRDLPSRSTPLAQKAVIYKGRAMCFILDTQGYMIADIDNPEAGMWNKTDLNLGFTPIVNSFTATSDALYILADDNTLYTSADGAAWSACDAKFTWLYGGYEDYVIGVEHTGGEHIVKSYPAEGHFAPFAAVDGFPVNYTSQLVEITSKWNSSTQALLLGGCDRNGTPIGAVWGFDGKDWGKVSTSGIPPVMSPTMFAYFNHEVSSTNWDVTKYPVLLAFGGIVEGEPTNTTYISYDNGVHWKTADDLLQLPEYIPAASQMQALVFESTLTASRSSDGWTAFPSRHLPGWWTIEALDSRATSWQCPYIYLFGGVAQNGYLLNNIWRGVINRLTFTPIE